MPGKIIVVLLLILVLVGCKKGNTPTSVNENPPPAGPATGELARGNFSSNLHPTSGAVRFLRDSVTNIRRLVFEDFKTDNGPDLRVWLSKNQTASDYQEVGQLKAISGDFSYQLAANQDPATYNYVLIWCEDFSVLFGHAILN